MRGTGRMQRRLQGGPTVPDEPLERIRAFRYPAITEA